MRPLRDLWWTGHAEATEKRNAMCFVLSFLIVLLQIYALSIGQVIFLRNFVLQEEPEGIFLKMMFSKYALSPRAIFFKKRFEKIVLSCLIIFFLLCVFLYF